LAPDSSTNLWSAADSDGLVHLDFAASADLTKLVSQCSISAAVHDDNLPIEVHERYFQTVIRVLDATELSARAKYMEEAATAAAEVLELKTSKSRGSHAKQQLAAAATRSAEAKARACAADDLRALLASTLETWGTAPARSVRAAQMLNAALQDEDTAVLDTEPGSESAGRNGKMFHLIPDALAKVCLQTRRQQDGNIYTYPVEDLREILETAVKKIADRLMSVSLGERSIRNACFERLSALHDAVMRYGKTEDAELLRSALAPMQWMKDEASQMAQLASKRLPTEQEQLKSKRQKTSRNQTSSRNQGRKSRIEVDFL